jgi:hypothetical protein
MGILALPTILSSELVDLGPTPFYQIVAKQRADEGYPYQLWYDL